MSQSPQSPDKELTDIFINYRRSDTSGHAGRLERDLTQRFPGRVFMDIHTIEVGTDFADAINSEVGKCGALIVMIGNQWLDITDPKTGKRRLDNPNDFVAIEIAEALKRNTRVIPVLVEGAKMPDAEELPAALAGLVRRNAIEITDTRWDYDVERLINVLEKICGTSAPLVGKGTGTGSGKGMGAKSGSGTGNGTTAKSGVLKIAIPLGVVLIAVVALALYLLSGKNSGNQTQATLANQSQAQVATPTPSNQLQSSDEPEGTAVVDLEGAEAEFLFPFKTAVVWEWYLNPPKPSEDGDEYHWEIYAEGKPEGDDRTVYRITVYIENGEGDSPKTGKFRALIANAHTGVKIWKAGTSTYGEAVDSVDADEIEITPTEQTVPPNGLKIVVKGAGVKRIFANKPKEVTLWTRTPKQEKESEDLIDVKYLPN